MMTLPEMMDNAEKMYEIKHIKHFLKSLPLVLCNIKDHLEDDKPIEAAFELGRVMEEAYNLLHELDPMAHEDE